MKRIIALLFASLLLTTQVCMAAPAGQEHANAFMMTTDSSESMQEEQTSVDTEHLVIGNPNPLRGEFFTDLWGNVTSDQDIRSLIHGYNLVYWKGEEGVFTYDPSVVSEIVVTENTAGDRTYTFAISNDLYYSNGERITAWDYAFSMLLQTAPEMKELGAHVNGKPQLLGYQAYADGTAPYLAGVRVLNDNTLAITVTHEYLPFFYEMALLSCSPYPVSEIAPGVAVRDDGNGVYLANADSSIAEPLFTAELLQKTILDAETGYQSHPSVVSGPYVLTSFDGETAELSINPYYKGNARGEKPGIRTLTYTYADNGSMIDGLADGTYDVLNKVVDSDAIDAGAALAADGSLEEGYAVSSYARTGMSFISFSCEKPAMADQAVRQAIAWCMDRDQVAADYVGSYGTRVDGYYGIGQWMYCLVTGSLNPPVDINDAEAMAPYEALGLDSLSVYSVNVDKAKQLLEEAGWKVNEETGIREKETEVTAADGTVSTQTVALDLTLLYPEGSSIGESLETNLAANLAEAGIRLTLVPTAMTDLLGQFYDPQTRDADMIFLASNFETVFDPSTYFTTVRDEAAAADRHVWRTTGLADEVLYQTAVAMRQTKPGDVLGYTQHWIDFQTRFNEVLPMLPVYSNTYYDFYTDALQNYNIAENISCGDALVGAYLAE